MTREILFRAKRAAGYGDAKKWLYGGFWVDRDGDAHIVTKGADFETVDPFTVGQFTGLTDRNGVRIFEGDIVNYNGAVHEVVFESRFYNARFGIVAGENETWSFGMSAPPNMMEVIGNVHDNPELMGEREDQ